MAAGDDPEPQEPLIRRWFSHTSRILLAAWWTTTRLAIVALIVLLLLPLKSAIFDRGLVIGEFTVPEELQKNGVTSAVVGRLLFDRISEMQRVATNNTAFEDTRLGATAFAAGEKATNLVDVKLPGADISLVSLVSQLRSLLHIKDTKIVGEIVISHKDHESTFVLRAHSTGGILWVENVGGLDIDSLIDKIAVLLVQRFDPLIAGFYHLRVPDKGGED